jgi:hypothetical protein
MTDMKSPADVQIQIDKSQPEWKLWVNVDGVCRLRIYGINPKTFALDADEVSHG